jgi:HSP90 family molecular chaperone
VFRKQKELKIDILSDKENKSVSVTETEIGMTRVQFISNFGTTSK